MKNCIDHPTQKGGKICKIIEPDGMRIEIYNGSRLVQSVWMTSEWDDYSLEDANSLIRKDKIKGLLKLIDKTE